MTPDEWLKQKGVSPKEAAQFIDYAVDLCDYLSGHPHARSQQTLQQEFGAWNRTADKIFTFGGVDSFLAESMSVQPKALQAEGLLIHPRLADSPLGEKLLKAAFPGEDRENVWDLLGAPSPAHPLAYTRAASAGEVRKALNHTIQLDRHTEENLESPIIGTIVKLETPFHEHANKMAEKGDARLSEFLEKNRSAKELAFSIVLDGGDAATTGQALRYIHDVSILHPDFSPDMGVDYYQRRLVADLVDKDVMGKTEAETFVRDATRAAYEALRHRTS